MYESEIAKEMELGRFDIVLKKHGWTRQDFADILQHTKRLEDREFLIQEVLAECRKIPLSQPPIISNQQPDKPMQTVIPQDMRETLFKTPLRTQLKYCFQVNKPLFKSYAVNAGCPDSDDVEEVLEGLTKRYFDGKTTDQVRVFQSEFRVFPSPEWQAHCEEVEKAKEAQRKIEEEKQRLQALENKKNEIKSVIQILNGAGVDAKE